MFSQFRSRVGSVWCNAMHESVMWPTHGHYECRTCGRRHLAFAESEITARPAESGTLSFSAKTVRVAAGLSRA